MAFKKAIKKKAKLRVLFIGPSGSGKTWTSLELASLLASHFRAKVAGIDSERGSMSKYAGETTKSGITFSFDVDELEKFGPETYVAKIQEAVRGGYGVIVADSLSHEWAGTGGILEKVDNAAASGNKWAGWRVGTPAHNAFVDALLQSPAHIVATARAKTEWVLEQNEKGKQVPKAVGMGAVQRDGLEFEFDVVVHLSTEHVGTVVKTRCPALDKAVLRDPAPELAAALIAWLEGGVEEPEPVRPEAVRPTVAPATTTSTGSGGSSGSTPASTAGESPATATTASATPTAESTVAQKHELALRAAENHAGLQTVATAIKADFDGGKLSKAEREHLVAVFVECSDRLTKAQAGKAA